MALLALRNVAARYGRSMVLDGIDLDVEPGEVLSLIGPSGSGKSTLLRVLIGLLPPCRGDIRFDGTAVDYQKRTDIRSVRERCAVVFQQYNLFQNMTALGNVTVAPIKVQGRNGQEVKREAETLLRRVGLGDKLAAFPDQLSGGQQQRVAIARALALKPDVLLLDEVTAALDPELVSEVLDVIRLLTKEGMTMLIVSHEMSFVREISNRVAFMAEGRIVEIGPPTQVFDAPTVSRTAEFVGKILRH